MRLDFQERISVALGLYFESSVGKSGSDIQMRLLYSARTMVIWSEDLDARIVLFVSRRVQWLIPRLVI